ncbi:hypothetical protein Tco_0265379 [Tanacetum coccineum]
MNRFFSDHNELCSRSHIRKQSSTVVCSGTAGESSVAGTAVNAPAGKPLGAYVTFGVPTPRALVDAGLMTSGDARS